MPGKRKVFVVLSRWWHFNDEYTNYSDPRPMKAFTSREAAEAFLARLEQRERALDNGEDPGGQSYSIAEMDLEP
jgi:hypothetical protein